MSIVTPFIPTAKQISSISDALTAVTSAFQSGGDVLSRAKYAGMGQIPRGDLRSAVALPIARNLTDQDISSAYKSFVGALMKDEKALVEALFLATPPMILVSEDSGESQMTTWDSLRPLNSLPLTIDGAPIALRLNAVFQSKVDLWVMQTLLWVSASDTDVLCDVLETARERLTSTIKPGTVLDMLDGTALSDACVLASGKLWTVEKCEVLAYRALSSCVWSAITGSGDPPPIQVMSGVAVLGQVMNVQLVMKITLERGKTSTTRLLRFEEPILVEATGSRFVSDSNGVLLVGNRRRWQDLPYWVLPNYSQKSHVVDGKLREYRNNLFYDPKAPYVLPKAPSQDASAQKKYDQEWNTRLEPFERLGLSKLDIGYLVLHHKGAGVLQVFSTLAKFMLDRDHPSKKTSLGIDRTYLNLRQKSLTARFKYGLTNQQVTDRKALYSRLENRSNRPWSTEIDSTALLRMVHAVAGFFGVSSNEVKQILFRQNPQHDGLRWAFEEQIEAPWLPTGQLHLRVGGTRPPPVLHFALSLFGLWSGRLNPIRPEDSDMRTKMWEQMRAHMPEVFQLERKQKISWKVPAHLQMGADILNLMATETAFISAGIGHDDWNRWADVWYGIEFYGSALRKQAVERFLALLQDKFPRSSYQYSVGHKLHSNLTEELRVKAYNETRDVPFTSRIYSLDEHMIMATLFFLHKGDTLGPVAGTYQSLSLPTGLLREFARHMPGRKRNKLVDEWLRKQGVIMDLVQTIRKLVAKRGEACLGSIFKDEDFVEEWRDMKGEECSRGGETGVKDDEDDDEDEEEGNDDDARDNDAENEAENEDEEEEVSEGDDSDGEDEYEHEEEDDVL